MKCPCMGEKFKVRTPNAFIDGQTRNIEEATGHAPSTCPWQALKNPLLADVIDLHRACSTGDGNCHPASALALNPSKRAWEGLLVYVDAIQRIRIFDRKKKEQASSKPKTGNKPGAVVYRG